MRKKSQSSRRYSLDGFVPRQPQKPHRRASMDVTLRRRQPDGFRPRKSGGIVSSDEKHGLVDSNVPEEFGSMRRPVDLGDLPTEEVKPRFWQWRKKRKSQHKPVDSHRKKIFKRVALVLGIILVLIGGFLGWKVLKNATKVFNGNILGFFDNTKLKGEENGRVNILLTGTSEDDPGHEGANLTDSIMLLSLDTRNNKAFMISIPRDLWVDYGVTNCSVGYQGKINAAYSCGEEAKFKEAGYPNGGVGLLEKVIEQNFGVDINYYVKLNYTAFKQAVNTVGGIDITLKTDDSRGILDRIFDWQCNYTCYKVKYANGPLHLNGEQALNLARARGDYTGYTSYGSGNDFGRTQRQRQMLLSLKDKALSVGVLSNPAKLSSLLDTAGKNVHTDFKTNELRRLYELSKLIKTQDIQSIGLTDEKVELVETFQAVDGSSAVRPTAGTNNFSQIKAYMKKLTSNDPVVREGASVVVLNGSGMIGLAQKRAETLGERGITVSEIGNASKTYSSTLIIDLTNGRMNSTKKILEEQLGTQATTITSVAPEAKNYQADFVVILGK